MKKNIYLLLIFISVVFCFPLLAKGAVVEMTVTINDFRIPQRAVMLGLPLNTVMGTMSARITAVGNDGSVQGIGNFPYDEAYPGVSTTFSFPYSSTLAPYNIYTEIQVDTASSTACKADCTKVSTGGSTGWYYIHPYAGDSHYTIFCWPTLPSCGYYDWAVCPAAPMSTCGGNNGFALPSASVVNGYWRSPSLYTITGNQ